MTNEHEGTHAYLPAGKVARACVDTLDDIKRSRREILSDVVDKLRDRGRLLPRRSEARARKLLMPEHYKAAELHRADHENVAGKLMGLSMAAAEDNPDFRIYVSLDDFQAIRDAYASEMRRKG